MKRACVTVISFMMALWVGSAISTAAPAAASAGVGLAGIRLHLATPPHVRGVYVTGWMAGADLQGMIDYVERHGLNAVVIDIKETDGRLSFPLPGTLADQLGANRGKMGTLQDVRADLRRLHAQGIYVIGRLVTFKDAFLATHRPGWAIARPNGGTWEDGSGGRWMDPAEPAVQAYNVQIAVAAAQLGFDEIQFDYVRYPDGAVPGRYAHTTERERTGVIEGFLSRAKAALAQVGVPVSADVFGITTVAAGDVHIGQSYPDLSDIVNTLSPMIYPSHYLPGDFDLPDPNQAPYATILATMSGALARLPAGAAARQRPWIQAFDMGLPHYGPDQVEAQIRALAALGIDSFLVWNPASRYSDGIDYSVGDRLQPGVPSPVWAPALYPLLSPAPGVVAWQRHIELPAVLGADDMPRAPYSVGLRVGVTRAGYSAELWETRAPLVVNDQEITSGRRLLAIQRFDDPAHIPALALPARAPTPGHAGFWARLTGWPVLPAGLAGTWLGEALDVAPQPAPQDEVVIRPGIRAQVVPEDGGVYLTWVEAGYGWRLWAPSLAGALAAARSLVAVPLPEAA